jgi:uncharacterized protein (TIGR02001 family)
MVSSLLEVKTVFIHLMKLAVLLITMVCTFPVVANVSTSLTLTNDYLFNGVSQTNKDAALQGSLDWRNDAGWYAGSWASNVDYADGTDIEVDFYGGKVIQASENVRFDLGIAAYTYYGDSQSDEGNYNEIYIKTSVHKFAINLWYTNDYFGTGAEHGILLLEGQQKINESLVLSAGIDYSKSFDSDKFSWEVNDSDYIHWHLTATLAFKGVSLAAGYHDTDLNTFGERRFLVSISKTFGF